MKPFHTIISTYLLKGSRESCDSASTLRGLANAAQRANGKAKLVAAAVVTGASLACATVASAQETSAVPGEKMSLKTKVGEATSYLLQSRTPLNQINTYISGILSFNGNIKRQQEAHTYLSHLNEDFHQGPIYDSNNPEARLIGVKYLISKKIFDRLPEDEKKLWSRLGEEVKSGQLVAPGLPYAAENRLMHDLAPTYGKTWLFWQVDRDPLPVGIPQLMIPCPTNQVNSDVLKERDAKLGDPNMTEKCRKNREDIKVPEGTNAWERGEVYQVQLKKVATQSHELTGLRTAH